MKVLLTVFSFFLSIFSGAFCQSAVPIVRQVYDNYPDGTYNYAFESANQIFVEEQGHLKDPENLVKQGQYQYTSPEGQLIRLVYTADENGFHPQGNHLPTPPPVPPLIQRSLEILELEEKQQQQSL